MTEVRDYAPHMTALYKAHEELGWALRDKKPAHDCQVLIVEIMRCAARLNEYVKERGNG